LPPRRFEAARKGRFFRVAEMKTISATRGLVVGRRYEMRYSTHKASAHKGRESGSRKCEYLGEERARAPEGKLFMFRNPGGAKESYTVFQLMDMLVG